MSSPLPPRQARRRRRRNWLKGAALAHLARRRCPLCGGTSRVAGASWMHSHLACRGCGLIFVAQLPSARDLEASYARVHLSDYQVDHKRDWAPWEIHKQRTLDALGLEQFEQRGPAGRALDVGCGEGRLLRVLQRRGWAAQGVELNAQLALQARRLGLEVMVGPLERIRPARRYQLITMMHLVEHLRRPLQQLQRVAGWLAPGGLLVLETPLSPDFANIDHLYCFSVDALLRLLRAASLQPLSWFDYVDDNYRHLNLAVLARGAGSSPGS